MMGLACGQDGIKKNHMDILWHEYGARDGNVPIREAGLQARASIVGRLGMMMLACGTGAWRVSCEVFTPVFVRLRDCVKLSRPSKQLY